MLHFKVDAIRCTRCNWCVKDCVMGIITRIGNETPTIIQENEGKCIGCQHCLTVCPAAAISIFGLTPDNSISLSSSSFPPLEQAENLVRGRRSVRHYQTENVPPELVDRLMAALANTPTGVNARELTFTLIDNATAMKWLEDRVMAALSNALSCFPERYSFLGEMVAGDPIRARAMIFRGAPHALVVSAPPTAPCADQDVPICLAYFEFLAQSAGLGTVWWGFLKMILELLPDLKPLLDLPPDYVYYAMLFGKPAIQYARTAQRDKAAVLRRLRME